MNPRRVIAQIDRMGDTCEVLKQTQTGTDDFNNPQYEYTPERTVTAFRTYPNRNTEVKNSRGDYHRDNPVFIFPKGEHRNDPPGVEDRIRYKGRLYEMQAPTHYDSHVEYFGQKVTG